MAGTTDTVPAMLTPGEFVIKQESAAMLGEPFLKQLNAISDNAAHGNIDALIGQAQLANMKPMYGGGEVVPGYENGGDVEGYPEGEWEEKFKSNLKNPSWEEYGMGEYATRERPGRYKDPIHKYISDMILSGRQDSLGGLIDDNYYKPLIEQELKFMNLQKRAQSAEDAIPSYSGKREGIDLGDIFGEQSLLKQRGKKKSISDYKYDLGETILGQRINELYANNLYGLDNSTKGFQEGGGVGEAGRKYPPGTLMSPYMGDKVSPQDKTATTPFQSPEQAAEFERMIKMLQIQEILKKAKESQTYDAEMIESDGKSILPPWQGKRNFKGNLYEDNIEFPVAREGYLQR